MRALVFVLVLLASSVIGGVAIGRYTVNGAAFAVAPGPAMPHPAWAGGAEAPDPSH